MAKSKESILKKNESLLIITDNTTKENPKVEDNKTKSLEPKPKEEEILIKEPAIFQG